MSSPTLKYILTLIAFALLGVLSLLSPLALMPHISSNKIFSYAVSQAVAFALSAAVVFVFTNLISNKKLSEIGLRFDRPSLKMTLWGGLIGACLIAATFALMVAVGAVKVAYANPTLKVISIVPVLMLIQALQVMSEELIFRTFMLVKLSEKMSETSAILVWAIAFGGLHLFGANNNPVAIAGIICAGVLLNAAYFVSGRNLWFTFGIHYGWNALQMHVLFSRRFFDLTYSRIWWLGGNGNAEGSIVSALAVFIAAVWMIAAHRRKSVLPT